MISPFESPINAKRLGYFAGLRPAFSDREFWSDVLMTPKDSNPPDVIYSLITSSGDRFIDSASNPLIAVT
tara:strand:- start:431 stop:640 length:210 start_codon:yes stop_codon:yes gene_type:complete